MTRETDRAVQTKDREPYPSIDRAPWAHPFLTDRILTRFREYSDKVTDFAIARRRHRHSPLNAAFAVNMAQNMYKWTKLATRFGADATLYLNPQDTTALNRPEWEEFDGEFAAPSDGRAFLRAYPNIRTSGAVVEAPNDGGELLTASLETRAPSPLQQALRSAAAIVSEDLAWRLFPPAQIAALHKRAPHVRLRPLLTIDGMYPYFAWAEMLSRHDVCYIASTPFAAYASGKPYCICSVGGDMQFDCGRSDALGRAMRMAFRSARFILTSNPHTLGHCRRLGFTNAVYLPYPMDSDVYAPGTGQARADWIARTGGEVYVLTTARIDSAVKGYTDSMFNSLLTVAARRPSVRFVFLDWGVDADHLKILASQRGLGDQFLVLPPVGKRRLIDYYRSCDIVLDQFVFGYLGATALEAASVGKPLVMNIRHDQYRPLYSGDLPPVEHASTPETVADVLIRLIDSPDRASRGHALRQWLVRNHGEQRTAPRMLAFLELAADNAKLPWHWDNPLKDTLSRAEQDHHERCRL